MSNVRPLVSISVARKESKTVASGSVPAEKCVGAEARFVKIVEALKNEPGVSFGGTSPQRFGHSALKAGGKIFAMVLSTGAFVVKLPAARVAELEQGGAGVPFQAGKGRPMKEWFAPRRAVKEAVARFGQGGSALRGGREGLVKPTAEAPNHSIERTSYSRLRLPPLAAHVER